MYLAAVGTDLPIARSIRRPAKRLGRKARAGIAWAVAAGATAAIAALLALSPRHDTAAGCAANIFRDPVTGITATRRVTRISPETVDCR